MKVKIKIRSILLLCVFAFTLNNACKEEYIKYDIENETERVKKEMLQADPTIFSEDGKYYLYGTNDEAPDNGFQVFTSTNMKTWWGPEGANNEGYALIKGDNFGDIGFWAPQVWKYQNQYYMAYTANENIAVSISDNPLGPFRSKTLEPVFSTDKQIDPFVFIDDDDKKYLFYVRLINGNTIYMAEMTDDFSAIKKETVTQCLWVTQDWENTENNPWTVIEGPTVLKHKGYYYLIYSANDFRNPDYAVGYAVSKSIYGPWEKSKKNPVLSRANTGWAGTGHGDIAYDKEKNMYYVFHSHNQGSTVPRKTAMVKVRFQESNEGADELIFDGETIYHLDSKE